MADLMGDDPAAEFLQQEEDQLRELGIDENQFNEPTDDDDNNVDIMNEFQDDLTPQEPMSNGFSDPAPMQQQISLSPAEEPESLVQWRQEKAENLVKQVFIYLLYVNVDIYIFGSLELGRS